MKTRSPDQGRTASVGSVKRPSPGFEAMGETRRFRPIARPKSSSKVRPKPDQVLLPRSVGGGRKKFLLCHHRPGITDPARGRGNLISMCAVVSPGLPNDLGRSTHSIGVVPRCDVRFPRRGRVAGVRPPSADYASGMPAVRNPRSTICSAIDLFWGLFVPTCGC
jgi:hypothetical protein